ncbi:MAG: NAD(P)-dependent alcohol dehydrogenase [Paracoccaceae bacterium]
MKAAVYTRYGGPEVVTIRDIPKPEPKDNEVLIKTHATCVNTADWRLRSLNVPKGFGLLVRLAIGITGPRKQVLGTELSGVIESVGVSVTQFKPGDAVIADGGFGMGCHAEYKTMPESGAIVLKPDNLSFEQAAALSFGGSTALCFLRNGGRIQKGDTVLVNGASGTTGLAFVQLAKYFGATVTGVCSTANLELVRKTGASRVIDYTKTEFDQDGTKYDVIVDTTGTIPWAKVKKSLTQKGRLMAVLGQLSEMLRAPIVSRKNGQKLITGTAKSTAKDMRFLAQLAENGDFKPILDCVLPFSEIQAAHARVDTGRKTGSVVITLDTTP